MQSELRSIHYSAVKCCSLIGRLEVSKSCIYRHTSISSVCKHVLVTMAIPVCERRGGGGGGGGGGVVSVPLVNSARQSYSNDEL